MTGPEEVQAAAASHQHQHQAAMADLEWKPFSLTYVEYPNGKDTVFLSIRL